MLAFVVVYSGLEILLLAVIAVSLSDVSTLDEIINTAAIVLPDAEVVELVGAEFVRSAFVSIPPFDVVCIKISVIFLLMQKKISLMSQL